MSGCGWDHEPKEIVKEASPQVALASSKQKWKYEPKKVRRFMNIHPLICEAL